MSNKREKSSDTEMTFFEHIEALRPHLVRGVLALVVVMIAAFIGKKFVIDWVLMGPQSPDFLTNRWLCDFSYGAGRSVQLAYAGGFCNGNSRRSALSVVGIVAICPACSDTT